MTPALATALAEVDRVFVRFTCRPDNVCAHCYPEHEVAPLAVPGAELNRNTLSSLAYRSPYSVDDHAALVRRILPQLAHGMVDGTVHTFWPRGHCLARGNWRTWPDGQVATIRAFADAWWLDLVTTDQPVHAVADAFETYAAIIDDLPAALAAWPAHPVADRHLVKVSDNWLHDLVHGTNPLDDRFDPEDAPSTHLRTWYLTTGVDCLRSAGAHELADFAGLLAVDEDERMRVLYGDVGTTSQD